MTKTPNRGIFVTLKHITMKKKKIVMLSALFLLTFTSCEQYVLPQETIAYSLSVFNATMSEYEATLEKLHDLETLQEISAPEVKDSLTAQMDSLFIQMSVLIGTHESTRVALETLSGKKINEITPSPVIVSVYRYTEAVRIFRNADATMQKEMKGLRLLQGVPHIGKNAAEIKKSERKLASFEAYYMNFAYIMQSLRSEKVKKL